MTAGDVRRDGLREAVTAIETHNGTSVTPENLRWAATHEALARSWIGDVLHGLADALDAVPDVPPTGYDWREAARYYEDDPSLLVGLAAPVPDVPPDPPAAMRDELARVLHDHPGWTEEVDEERTSEHSVVWRFRCAGCKELLPRGPGLLGADSRLIAHQADALLSSGRLVDAADVRARALEQGWDEGHAATDEHGPYNCDCANPYYEQRAVSERERTT